MPGSTVSAVSDGPASYDVLRYEMCREQGGSHATCMIMLPYSMGLLSDLTISPIDRLPRPYPTQQHESLSAADLDKVQGALIPKLKLPSRV